MALANRQPNKERPRIKKAKSMTSLADVESLSMPLIQEVVLSADIRCADCQKRIADIMSRMSETESVSVNVLEKKVTLTCKYPGTKLRGRQVDALQNPSSKISLIKPIFPFLLHLIACKKF